MEKCLSFFKKYKYVFLIIILYIILFIQMQNIYFYGDDYQVLYPLHANRNFFSILKFCIDKMHWFWTSWSGRITGHFIVSFGLSFFGIQFVRILNPIMLFLMIFLMIKIVSLFIKVDIKKWVFWISFVFLGVNIYISREILYWSYASILYVWGFVLTLFVMYFVLKKFCRNEKISIMQVIVFSCLIFIQSFIIEQLNVILLATLLLLNILDKVNTKKINKKMMILLIISICGSIISIMAPGNMIRTDPLVEELVGVSFLKIMLGKIHCFLNILFNNRLYGVYLIGFSLIIGYSYKKKIKKCNIFNMLPLIFIYSLITIILLERLFGFNILGGYTELDALYIFYYTTDYTWIVLIIRMLYYLMILGSIIYMFLKTIDKNAKLLAMILGICFISTILPTVLIRYTATRYYLFLFAMIIVMSIYYIVKENAKMFDLKMMMFFLILFPNDIYIYILLVIIILKFFFESTFEEFIDKHKLLLSKLLIISYLSLNFGDAILGYSRNSATHQNNINVMGNYDKNVIMKIKAIPYKNRLYGWHTIYTNYSYNSYSYYGFYLNAFYEDFYEIDTSNIVIEEKED